MFIWFTNLFKRAEVDVESLVSDFTSLRDRLFAFAEKEKQEAYDLEQKATAKINSASKATTIGQKLHEIVS